jgi:hypothetical protein
MLTIRSRRPGCNPTPDGDSRHCAPKHRMGQAEPTGLQIAFEDTDDELYKRNERRARGNLDRGQGRRGFGLSRAVQIELGGSLLSGVAEHEVVELVLSVPGRFTGRGKEREEQLAEVLGPHGIEVVLPFAARLDQSGDP